MLGIPTMIIVEILVGGGHKPELLLTSVSLDSIDTFPLGLQQGGNGHLFEATVPGTWQCSPTGSLLSLRL
ncbi:hypothetical protein LEMLEM_LOCUS13741, partial [Lemmus lemmus]